MLFSLFVSLPYSSFCIQIVCGAFCLELPRSGRAARWEVVHVGCRESFQLLDLVPAGTKGTTMASMEQEGHEHIEKATAEANEMFAKLGEVVEEATRDGTTRLDVLDIAKRAGLELDERILEDLKIDRIIYPLPWLPWHHWYPWRPLWCWWWGRYYPYYRCCPWWWHRCHWYLG